ncbi:MAG: BtpA/SgcQ family protein [Chloroflexi bacterium]|nr:BtpA/SgcQ family protein [Chloroflexota bacterium]
MGEIGIMPPKPDALRAIFGRTLPIIGMIHLQPLPGAPRFAGGSLAPVLAAALADARALRDGGVDGLMVENHGDLPFSKPDEIGHETVAAMAALVGPIMREADLPVGINVLANGARPALAVARATGAAFVRVNQWVNAYVANEGIVEGPAARALRYRSAIKGDDIRIFADVHVKHGAHAIVADRSVAEQARDAVFFDADVLIATGQRTGDATDTGEVATIQRAGGLPVLVGSGLTPVNAATLLTVADGAIVGTAVKRDGVWWGPVVVERVRELMAVVRAARASRT